jgi:hypothetical protein
MAVIATDNNEEKGTVKENGTARALFNNSTAISLMTKNARHSEKGPQKFLLNPPSGIFCSSLFNFLVPISSSLFSLPLR